MLQNQEKYTVQDFLFGDFDQSTVIQAAHAYVESLGAGREYDYHYEHHDDRYRVVIGPRRRRPWQK